MSSTPKKRSREELDSEKPRATRSLNDIIKDGFEQSGKTQDTIGKRDKQEKMSETTKKQMYLAGIDQSSRIWTI